MAHPLLQRILDRDIRAAGRLMRLVDDEDPRSRALLDELFHHTGHAHIIGFTGSPGSGKSTLVNAFISECRRRDLTIGVIAVDPTSPFSGGAILGDRIRMQDHALDEGVFIRSVATRGNLGGLSRSTPALVQILDAMGFDLILIETVGVGQDEVDIVRLADTNLVVGVPGLGDDIQATKAGIMEIADIFVVNKSDRDGARRLRREIETMLSLGRYDSQDWKPPVLHTTATRAEGLTALFDQIDAHRQWLKHHDNARLRTAQRSQYLLRLIIRGEIENRLDSAMSSPQWRDQLQRIAEREISPYAAASHLLKQIAQDGDS